MEGFNKFQWSVFVDSSHNEQVVVRADDFAEFLEGIELVKGLLTILVPEEQEPEIPSDVCTIHNKPMKRRESRNGGVYYDHRWKQNDVWHVCDGKHTRVQEG